MKQVSDKLKKRMNKAKEIFLTEVKDKLPEALESFNLLKSKGYDEHVCSTLYRFAHTLKGSGQTIGLLDISEPAGEMAVALLMLKNYGVSLSDGVISFLEERIEEIVYEVSKDKSDDVIPLVPARQSREKKKVFIIDDDSTITRLIQEALMAEGFIVRAFHDTSEVRNYIHAEKPDLIILDIILPSEEDGIEFCRKLRSCEICELIPIMFLSRKNKLNDKLVGFATGADDYLCKPFQIEELVARVKAIINRLEVHQNLILQDELTKVYNRRYMEQRLREEIARTQRSQHTFSIAMIDIDFFKNINDKLGHAVGDECLQYLVKVMNENLRSSDVICRYGGEEFLVILPNTSKETAYKVIKRLQQQIAIKQAVLVKSEVSVDITISAGVTSYSKDGGSVDELLKSADTAMYQAKNSGRNKVVLFKEEAICS